MRQGAYPTGEVKRFVEREQLRTHNRPAEQNDTWAGPGIWRSPPTPTDADGTLPAVFPQLATLKPFVMNTPSQFRPGPPPVLT